MKSKALVLVSVIKKFNNNSIASGHPSPFGEGSGIACGKLMATKGVR